MNLSFDYYKNLKDVELYLCNPNEKELYALPCLDRKLTLRFNDLSELTFTCYETIRASDGEMITIEGYEYIQTRRLIYVTDIGWFTIVTSNEYNNGAIKYKEVTCHSLQAVFKDKGIYCEERVYYLYNPSDPYDNNYISDDEASIPSVVGQLYQQFGIHLDLDQGCDDPIQPYACWTITYINSALIGKGRNFKESNSSGYEWMVKTVENAFEVVFIFDFYYKTIRIMLPNEITKQADVIYSFSNFVKDLTIEENAENIVTVMNCNGDNCNIMDVNPTGSNYICDFSYYMDAEGKWMSEALKTKIKSWTSAVAEAKPDYEAKILELRASYDNLADINVQLQDISRIYTDLAAAAAKKSVAMVNDIVLSGIVWAESVDIGNKSMEPNSAFYNVPLAKTHQITVYKNQPAFDSETGAWSVSGDHFTGTLDECFAYTDASNNRYVYFIDISDGKSGDSYCVLQGNSEIDKTSFEAKYTCKGFKRYVDLQASNLWMNKYDIKKSAIQAAKETCESAIEAIKAQLEAYASTLNIIKYFADSPALLKELYCYWIEGDYTNDNIAITDDTTQSEAIELANELLESGKIELSKVCQPKYQFTLTSVNCLKQYEFEHQMNELELGKIVAVEKDEGVWYYPALLEIEYDLDNTDSFSLRFANALRLDDWGYTYGDLISSAASTSRQVSANWQNFISYTKDRAEIGSLIKEPLSTTLRAAFANMTNQEFMIDETGILGRKFSDSTKGSFIDEQIRIVNNVILFTDDNWETAKTALGKIYFLDDEGNKTTAYGLAAETVVGALIMGEKLKIKNKESTVTVQAEGITIKKSDGTVVFEAKADGTLTVRNYASKEALDELIDGMKKNRASIEVLDGQIKLKADEETVDALGNRISYAETSIEQNAYEITLRAQKSTVDTLSKSVTDAWAEINVMAGQIELKASQTTVDSLGRELSSANTRITQNAEAIELKAEKSTVDALSDELSAAQTKITQTAESIELKADKTTVDALGNRLSDAETSIEQNATQIKFKASNLALNKLADRVDTCESEITQNATEIAAKVSQTYGSSSSSFGWSLTSSGFYIYSDAATVLKVTSSGLEVSGKVKATSGTIGGWTISANELYSGTAGISTGATYLKSSLVSSGATSPVRFYCGNGDRINGKFIVLDDGSLYASAAKIEGNVTATAGKIGGFNISDNFLCYGTATSVKDATGTYMGKDGIWASYGAFGTISNAFIVENTGIKKSYTVGGSSAELRIATPNLSVYISGMSTSSATWLNVISAANAWANSSSDERIKNSIEDLPSAYESLFDSLTPRRYKYNDGTSGRYHTGFVAQEVVSAVESSGLSTQDFAAVVKEFPDSDIECWHLRRDEFVALNTWQIQKLKARVKELETIVSQLQDKE